jgi:DNA modification methylase
MPNNSVDVTLTDIPYGEINRKDNGLRNLDKSNADIMTFDLDVFLNELYRITRGTIIIFCGQHQLSEIKNFFQEKQDLHKGTVRQLIWKKTNPSPMNGKNIYLSGIENAIWFKKRGATFNANCKNTVFEYPCGKNKLHPTQKNLQLIEELIADSSNVDDIIFDPCMGSGTTGVACLNTNRNFIGIELEEKYFNIAKQRIETQKFYTSGW